MFYCRVGVAGGECTRQSRKATRGIHQQLSRKFLRLKTNDFYWTTNLSWPFHLSWSDRTPKIAWKVGLIVPFLWIRTLRPEAVSWFVQDHRIRKLFSWEAEAALSLVCPLSLPCLPFQTRSLGHQYRHPLKLLGNADSQQTPDLLSQNPRFTTSPGDSRAHCSGGWAGHLHPTCSWAE